MIDMEPAAAPDDGFHLLAQKIMRDTTHSDALATKINVCARRIAVRMRANGVTSYPEYATLLDADAREYERLLDVLTINVTRFFRNWPTFESVARNVIPALWAKPGPIRIWSAGMASGEEVYSVAALFLSACEYSLRPGCGTVPCIHPRQRHRSGQFSCRRIAPCTTRPAFADTPPTNPGKPVFPLARGISHCSPCHSVAGTFRAPRHSAHEPAPDGVFDFITCRNVIIYFDRLAQEELFSKFYHSLAPGGYLLLGRVETLLGETRALFQPVDLRERIFRKADEAVMETHHGRRGVLVVWTTTVHSHAQTDCGDALLRI